MARPLVVVALIVAAVLAGIGSPASAAAGTPADDPRRGVVYEGLEPADPGGECPGGFEMTTGDATLCTHGPDPAPDGIDVRQRREPERRVTPAEGPSPFACFGDGRDGFRVQVIYARAADVADHYNQYAASFVAWTARVDQMVADSAAETGGIRRVRFQTDASCHLAIDRVVLSAAGDDTFGATMNELHARGYTRTDRKYLVYVDANIYCGLGQLAGDDTASAVPGVNRNNGHFLTTGFIARVDNGCWGTPDSVEAHEVMHTLGGVQNSAPHATGGSHCLDEHDRMCGDDGYGGPTVATCPLSHENLFDCNHDDYFSTDPAPGSYLATHWNTANSSFLGPVKVEPALTWGFNAYGQVGRAAPADQPAPGPVSLTEVEAVAAGGFHSLAVVDGQVWAWGLGHVGQLGRPWPAGSATPAVVPGLSDVVAVSAGAFHSLALTADGTVWAWGWNPFGQLGDGTTVDRWQPVQVVGLTRAVSISAGAAHNLARMADGTVWSWGFGGVGQLGRGGSPLVPGLVPIGVPVESIAAGGYHSLAVSAGMVMAWGWNVWGQLGDGTETNRDRPAGVPGLTGFVIPVVSLAAGIGHSVVARSDGTVLSWGLDNTGQLGRPTGAPLSRTAGVVPGLSDVRLVVAGGYQSAAIDTSGRMSSWGWNAFGQVGDGSRVDRPTPVTIARLAGARAVALGIAHGVMAPSVVFDDSPPG